MSDTRIATVLVGDELPALPRSADAVSARVAPLSGLGLEDRLRELVELRHGSARDAEDLAPAPTEGNPGLERLDALGAQALEERVRQFNGQSVRHAVQS